FLMLITVLQATAGSYAQTITLKVHNMPLPKAMERIQAQSGYFFFLKGEELARLEVSVEITKTDLKDAMNILTKDLGLEWVVQDKTIIVRPAEQRVYKKVATTEVIQQERIINGTIADEFGNPLEGVTVSVKEARAATTSDERGNYRITLPKGGSTLIFSILGFQEKEQSIGVQNTVNVSLKIAISDLDEVVVVGYGTQKRQDVTGSISSISESEIKNVVITSADQALQGRAAGVQMTQTSSAPGGNVSVRIRGGNSLSAGNEPLYVIDGFPIYNDNGQYTAGALNNGQPANVLASLNPSDIESMEILKDASATAIY